MPTATITGSASPRRSLPILLTLLAVLGVAAVLLAAPRPATDQEHAEAAAAVRALTDGDGPGALAALPADFAEVMGYPPVLQDGELVRPDGDCSSPVPLPARFEPVCAQHDLGYDLLRYADAQGAPLSGWARVALDEQMTRRMHATCADASAGPDRVTCTGAAAMAGAAVRLNSARQLDAAPVEGWASHLLTWLPALSLAGLSWAGLSGLGRARRRGRARSAAVRSRPAGRQQSAPRRPAPV